jgi:hypothetical protein
MNTIDATRRRRRWPGVLPALAAVGEWHIGLGPDGWHGGPGSAGVLGVVGAGPAPWRRGAVASSASV